MGDFTHIPDVYVYDADNNAEPYWQMMVLFLSFHSLVLTRECNANNV